jgi:DNA-binding PadR family transcriptional regulator
MPETTFDNKIKLKKTMRNVIVDTWLNTGSPVTIQGLHDMVEKKIDWNPSWNTIKANLEDMQKKGLIETMKLQNNQTIWFPKKEKIKALKKINFEEY